MTAIRAYLNGGRAFDSHQSLADNPYEENTPEHLQWRKGYVDASRQVSGGWKGIVNRFGQPYKGDME